MRYIKKLNIKLSIYWNNRCNCNSEEAAEFPKAKSTKSITKAKQHTGFFLKKNWLFGLLHSFSEMPTSLFSFACIW